MAAHPRRGRIAVIALAPLVVGMGALAAIQVTQRAGEVTYIRYVSPPMPDGSRYTFLYPRQAEPPRVTLQDSRGLDLVCHYRTATPWDRLLKRFGVPRDVGAVKPIEAIGVDILDFAGRPAPAVQRERIFPNGDWIDGMLTVVDPATHRVYSFNHMCPQNAKAYFKLTDPVVMRSFRVLHPGES